MVTHEYTILFGGVIVPGGDAAVATAIAWAEDTILAIGDEREVRAISRGDSRFVDLAGARVEPFRTALEVGGPADLRVLGADARPIAIVRNGVVIEGNLPDGPPARAEHAP